jgi:hypothetical protein
MIVPVSLTPMLLFPVNIPELHFSWQSFAPCSPRSTVWTLLIVVCLTSACQRQADMIFGSTFFWLMLGMNFSSYFPRVDTFKYEYIFFSNASCRSSEGRRYRNGLTADQNEIAGAPSYSASPFRQVPIDIFTVDSLPLPSPRTPFSLHNGSKS